MDNNNYVLDFLEEIDIDTPNKACQNIEDVI